MHKGVAQKLSLPSPLEIQTLNGHKSVNFKIKDFCFWIWIADIMGKICCFYSFSLSLTIFSQIGKNQFFFVRVGPLQ